MIPRARSNSEVMMKFTQLRWKILAPACHGHHVRGLAGCGVIDATQSDGIPIDFIEGMIPQTWNRRTVEMLKSTLWLCQNSFGKWPFIVDFPNKDGGFQQLC